MIDNPPPPPDIPEGPWGGRPDSTALGILIVGGGIAMVLVIVLKAYGIL